MQRLNKAASIWLTATLMLLLLGLTGCYGPKQTIVLPEAKTVKIEQGQAAPFEGWLLTDGAMATIIEAAERCQGM